MKKSKVSLLVVLIFVFSLFSTNAFAISDDHVLSQNIKEADGTTGQDTNTGSGIKTGHIQDGAVTPAKIGFYSNVIIVAPSGGDFTSPVDAMNAITDASATNPYLVKIMPGIYDVGSIILRMKPYVDIEGSGENVTKIRGNPQGVFIYGASNAEIRLLSIEHYGGVNHAIGISNRRGASTRMKNLNVRAFGANYDNFGIENYDNVQFNATPQMTDVTVSAYGNGQPGSRSAGVFMYSSSIKMNNVIATASGGADSNYGVHIYTVSYAPRAEIDNCKITDLHNETPISPPAMITYISNTMLNGNVINSGILKCIGVYDVDYNPYVCP